jgi:hypothetical protein
MNDLTESIEKATELQNKIWQGVLRLVITLSASLLLVTIALVEKIFSSTIPTFIVISWVLYFVSIVIGIVAEINEVIFFSNWSLAGSQKIQKYAKLLSSEKEIPYPPDDECLMTYNDIKWGVIAIGSFIFAVLFMCAALLEKIISCVWVWVIIIVGTIFIVGVTIHLIRKRKTGD